MVRVHPDRPAGSAGGQSPGNRIGRQTVKAEPEGVARAKAHDL